MARKKPSGGEGGGNWMDTYGDLVTLLLTFFVLLYSMSNLDAKKWEIFVRSIGNSDAEKTVEEVAINSQMGETEQALEGSMEIPEHEILDVETLYLTLMEKLNETGITGLSVSRGEDYTFIVFQDNPFFDGDSSVLTEQGKEVLDVFCQVIEGAEDLVAQINIMGHTAQADPEKPNTVRTDRMLSSMRAAEVCIYIQDKNVIQPEKLVCLSYGQHRPVASFDTAENRAKNRRVEILLLDNGADVNIMNDFYDDLGQEIYTEKSETAPVAPNAATDEEGFEFTEPTDEDVATKMSPISAPEETKETSGEAEPTSNEAEQSGAEENTSGGTAAPEAEAEAESNAQ